MAPVTANVLLQRLSEITRRARQEEQSANSDQRTKKMAELLLEDEKFVQKVIDEIPAKAEKEAGYSKNEVLIVAFPEDGLKRPLYNDREKPTQVQLRCREVKWDICEPSWLKPRFKRIYDWCQQNGLRPLLKQHFSHKERWYGFAIWISWD